METFLILVLIIIQYITAIVILIFDSSESNLKYKMIKTKKGIISLLIPFGYLISMYYYITNLWKELD